MSCVNYCTKLFRIGPRLNRKRGEFLSHVMRTTQEAISIGKEIIVAVVVNPFLILDGFEHVGKRRCRQITTRICWSDMVFRRRSFSSYAIKIQDSRINIIAC